MGNINNYDSTFGEDAEITKRQKRVWSAMYSLKNELGIK